MRSIIIIVEREKAAGAKWLRAEGERKMNLESRVKVHYDTDTLGRYTNKPVKLMHAIIGDVELYAEISEEENGYKDLYNTKLKAEILRQAEAAGIAEETLLFWEYEGEEDEDEEYEKYEDDEDY